MNTNMFRRRSRTKSKRKGAVLVLVAVMAVFLMAMVAFSVDIGHLADTKGRLRAAVDSGSLAAAGALAESLTLAEAEAAAMNYVQNNTPSSYGSVTQSSDITFGIWDPATKTFTPDSVAPNAVRVVAQRTASRGNAVQTFFGRVLGQSQAEISVEAIAVGSVPSSINTSSEDSVYVTSTKDLSNVVLQFADGVHQKFEGLHGYTGNFSGTGDNAGKQIVGVWIKSGCNGSGDGSGYGEYVAAPGDTTTVHGANEAHGCTPHVTASFDSTGVVFEDAGSTSPVRLVK